MLNGLIKAGLKIKGCKIDGPWFLIIFLFQTYHVVLVSMFAVWPEI